MGDYICLSVRSFKKASWRSHCLGSFVVRTNSVGAPAGVPIVWAPTKCLGSNRFFLAGLPFGLQLFGNWFQVFGLRWRFQLFGSNCPRAGVSTVLQLGLRPGFQHLGSEAPERPEFNCLGFNGLGPCNSHLLHYFGCF